MLPHDRKFAAGRATGNDSDLMKTIFSEATSNIPFPKQGEQIPPASSAGLHGGWRGDLSSDRRFK